MRMVNKTKQLVHAIVVVMVRWLGAPQKTEQVIAIGMNILDEIKIVDNTSMQLRQTVVQHISQLKQLQTTTHLHRYYLFPFLIEPKKCKVKDIFFVDESNIDACAYLISTDQPVKHIVYHSVHVFAQIQQYINRNQYTHKPAISILEINRWYDKKIDITITNNQLDFTTGASSLTYQKAYHWHGKKRLKERSKGLIPPTQNKRTENPQKGHIVYIVPPLSMQCMSTWFITQRIMTRSNDTHHVVILPEASIIPSGFKHCDKSSANIIINNIKLYRANVYTLTNQNVDINHIVSQCQQFQPEHIFFITSEDITTIYDDVIDSYNAVEHIHIDHDATIYLHDYNATEPILLSIDPRLTTQMKHGEPVGPVDQQPTVGICVPSVQHLSQQDIRLIHDIIANTPCRVRIICESTYFQNIRDLIHDKIDITLRSDNCVHFQYLSYFIPNIHTSIIDKRIMHAYYVVSLHLEYTEADEYHNTYNDTIMSNLDTYLNQPHEHHKAVNHGYCLFESMTNVELTYTQIDQAFN